MFFPYYVATDREWEYRQGIPWVVAALLASYLGVHMYLDANAGPEEQLDLFYQYGVVGCRLQWYSFFTCTFLHGGWMHLIGNCFYLLLYGVGMERLLGSARFLVLYVAGALFSMGVHVITLKPYMMDIPAIGASGAIAAVLGGFFVLMPKAGVRCLVFVFIRPFLVTLPACLVLGVWMLWQVYSAVEPAFAQNAIAFWAHVAGFAAGTGVATLLYHLIQHRSRRSDQKVVELLAGAWEAFLSRRDEEAARSLDDYTRSMADSYRASQPLLAGLLRLRGSDDPGGVSSGLFDAFQRAMDRLDVAGALTAYLQIRNNLPDHMVPACIHRDAAMVSLSALQPTIGLRAMAGAFAGGLDEGIDTLLERAEAVLRNTLGLPDAADRVAGLRGEIAVQGA